MSKVNGQSVAAQRRACGRDPPKEKKKKMFHVKHGPVACCLWTTLVGCGACLWAGPTLFFFSLTVIMFVFTLRTKNFVASVLF